jgi:hypothetical protein
MSLRFATHARRIALSGAIACACAQAEPMEEEPPVDPMPRALVDVDAWSPMTGDAVPEALRPPEGARLQCEPELGFGPEVFGGDWVFEVNTGYCNWSTFEQPLLDDIVEGELVRPRLWHGELVSFVPAEGYAAVAIADEVLWEYRVSIPSKGHLAADGWIADDDIPAGTPIRFHVHNHGINSWNLVEVTVEPPPE